MNILEDLWFGNISPWERPFKKDSAYAELLALVIRHQEDLLIQKCITGGQSYAIDNTNPQKADRARYIPAAKAAGYHIIGYFLESKIADCIERNRRRSGKERIPDTAVACISNKLEMPSLSEGFDELFFVKNNGRDMEIQKWRESHEI